MNERIGLFRLNKIVIAFSFAQKTLYSNLLLKIQEGFII